MVNFLLTLVISANVLIYRTDIIKSIPSEVVLGSIFDFIITIPFIITNQHLHMQVGIMQQLNVPLAEIKSIHYYQGPEKLSKDKKRDI